MAKNFNYRQIQGVEGNPNVSAEFIAAVERTAERLETRPEYLLAAMSFETGGTFSPSIRNSIGATGLIQFLKSTAKALGTTTAALGAMSGVEQLEFVEKYFRPFIGRLSTLEAVYTAILSGSPKKPSDVLFRAGTPAYKMNPLDWNQDGRITAAEATTIVGARLFGGVKAVQRRLVEGGFVPAGAGDGFDDGRWGTNTSKALAAFQKSAGLAETGLMDEATGLALFGETAAPPAADALARGAEGDAVKVLQDALVDLGYLTTEQIGGGYGRFGPLTEGAVETFQKHLGLPVSGRYGEVERVAVRRIADGISKGTAENGIVKAVQNRLVQLGLMTQAQVDTGHGTFGNKTEAAVKNFQTAQQLPPSGVVEAVTFRLLFNSETPAEPAGGGGVSMGESGTHYTALADVLITDTVKSKIERVAALYFEKTGKKITVTSGYRPPERQAPAMYNKIVNEGEAAVRRLYRNKTAVDQILAAFRANRGNRDAAIAAMTAVIAKQVKNGVFISSHLRSNAIDVRMTADFRALNEAVHRVGGRIVIERDHFHLELH